jgi:hypothetical protein
MRVVSSPSFAYCSLWSDTAFGERAVSMEGYFVFVPGTKDEPLGEPFRVAVARFLFPETIRLDPAGA